MNDLGTCWSQSFSLETTVFLVTKHISTTRAKPSVLSSGKNIQVQFLTRPPPPSTNPPPTSAEDSQLFLAFALSALFPHTILVLPPWRHFLLPSPRHCWGCCSSRSKTSCKPPHIETTSSGNQLQAQKAPGVQGCRSACDSEHGVSIFHIYNFERSERTCGVLHEYFSQSSPQTISTLLNFFGRQQKSEQTQIY